MIMTLIWSWGNSGRVSITDVPEEQTTVGAGTECGLSGTDVGVGFIAEEAGVFSGTIMEEGSGDGLEPDNCGASSEANQTGVGDGVTSASTSINDRLTGKFVSKNVVNLSKRTLSDLEISVLSKGLQFCPTPKHIDKGKLKEDLEVFGRKLRLRWHFRDEEGDFADAPVFRKKSTFNPRNIDAQIELYLSQIEGEIMQISEAGSNFSNLSAQEQQALRDLQNDSSIVIKGADKGSAIVVWDREDYLKEADSQLSDTDVYEECVTDPLPQLQKAISDTLRGIRDRGDIMAETLEFFQDVEARLGRFYLLPKIHKRLRKVPGRPVISNTGYHTEKISAFLDYHLQPLSKNIKSYVKDTNDFLKKIRDLPDLPEDVILCTIDVTGLYPNIPHEDGLAAIREALDSREDQKISTDSLVELAELVLKNNYFEHNGKTYKQKRGTAIGTKFAPPYAILTMDKFERKALEEATLKPLFWWRYIDDIIFGWVYGEEKLREFIDYLNSIHPTIKFTAKWSTKSIEFLDVMLTIVGPRIKTDLFVKETDTHQYLHFSSCHPFHTKKGIPYGQALRLRRICSDEQDFELRCEALKSWLLDRGFDSRMVSQQVDRAKGLDRNALLNKEEGRVSDSRINFVLTYHPALNTKIIEILHRNHRLLQTDDAHKWVFEEFPRVAFRRPKNLKDHLVRAKLCQPDEGPKGCSGDCIKCRSDCQVGNFLQTTTNFMSHQNGITYNIRVGLLHCNSRMVIYLLTCKTCSIQYVGKSFPPFRARLNNYTTKHRKYLERKQNNTLHIGKKVPQAHLHAHFAQPDHNGIDDFSFVLIDQAFTEKQLRQKECFWIFKLGVKHPQGLNVRDVDLILE